VAIAELVANSGSQFDPRVVEVFLPIVERQHREASARERAEVEIGLVPSPQAALG
jgi:HD-GYP domain-containing protein (c-di-GMP phosphodiesterase class II)